MATSPSSKQDLQDYFHQLSNDARDLFLPSAIAELTSPPSPIEFLRQYVMPNIPVVIRGGVQHWPAIAKWTDEYLCQHLGDKMVTVAMTPNGYADAPLDDRFILPHEEKMKMKDFLRILNDKTSSDVVYIQKQNSSFTDEFSELIPDAAKEIGWATEAFGSHPDAINFWMGGERSITSTHKDPYENLYGVVRGSKKFLLFPPVDLPFLPYELYSLAKYQRTTQGCYEIIDIVNEKCCHKCELTSFEHNKDFYATPLVRADNIHKTESCKLSDIQTFDTSQSSRNHLAKSAPNHCGCSCHKPDRIPWIAVDPFQTNKKHFETFKNTKPLSITLYAGDLLYLPSLWFHHVMQDDGTIAVNFWYDMAYDLKYAYFKFLENLSQPKLADL